MALRKKGIFFTLISIFIVAVLVMVASSQSPVTLKDEIPITQTVVGIGNDYIRSMDDIYLSRTVQTISYRALNALILYMNKTGAFLADPGDFKNKFAELVVNGTIGGQPVLINGINPMQGYNLTKRLYEFENISMQTYNINTTFDKDYNRMASSVVAFESEDTGPWQVAVNVTLNYTVNMTLASWKRISVIQIKTPIERLDDPLYALNWTGSADPTKAERAFTNKIFLNPATNWNVTTFNNYINSSRYVPSSRAPSFLKRFYQDYTPSACCGIESAVNPSVTGNNQFDKSGDQLLWSYIDWCYFGTEKWCRSFSLWNITRVSNYTPGGYNNGFKVDINTTAIYNLSDWMNKTYCDPAKPC